MKQKERFEILLEDLDSKLDGVVESVNSIHPRLDRIELRLETIETDVKIISGVVCVNSADISELKAKSHSH